MGLFAKMSETVRALIGEYSQTQNEMIYYSNQCGCRGINIDILFVYCLRYIIYGLYTIWFVFLQTQTKRDIIMDHLMLMCN